MNYKRNEIYEVIKPTETEWLKKLKPAQNQKKENFHSYLFFILYKYHLNPINNRNQTQNTESKYMEELSQDVQTWFSVQLAFAKFLSKIKGNSWMSAVSMVLSLYQKKSFILDRKLAKVNCTGNHVCKSCDKVVLERSLKHCCDYDYNSIQYSLSQMM